ncbi:MAG: shikimate kinase [Verrucomicrobiota bacterium]|nr:shikimate kinase [Verrucomicrobiota bacterium]
MAGSALVLIGFMGTGKSSVGRAVAERLRLPRFDTDELVSARFGLPISAIFEQFGELDFRAAEQQVLAEVDGKEPAVVVTGGGILLRAQNVERCRQLGVIAHLTADEQTIFDRVSRRPSRPLLQSENPRARMCELLAQRLPLYRALADFEINTGGLTHAEAADALIAGWNTAATPSDRKVCK